MKFKLRRNRFSFRNRVVVIIVGITLGAVSLLYTNNMARKLREKEQHDVVLWAHAMERINRDVLGGSTPFQDPSFPPAFLQRGGAFHRGDIFRGIP